ncbi:uncharacterized protein [Branchiostoma lanceolatum]|uniref:uncharacterized protein isoform X2 n=1 Tax=Branchiostoma lanceolatum TaxID=7740 RepID=UPI003452D4EB
MYEGTPESCECEPAVLTQSHPLHRTSQERWDGANLFSRSTQVQEITPDPDEVTGSPYTMATDDICETSKDLPGPSGPQSTRSCSLSSQESVKQWLKSVDRDAESPYPGEDSVAVDETLTDTAVHDGVMEYPCRGKISRGDSTEDDLTLGSEAQLLDPPVTTTSAGIPHASAVFAGTRCYWLSNHARMSRQARLMQMGESFESFATDTSTQTSQSSSIEGLLQSRKCDPEELLLSLGFGGGRDENRSLRVPDRFLQQQSRCGGVDLAQLMVREMAPDTTYQGWAGVFDRPVSTLYHRRMSTGSIPAYNQYGTYDPELYRRTTKSKWNHCQPLTDHRKDMTADSSHDPLRRSVTVSSNNTVTQPSSTGASIADVTGEVEDSAVQMLQQHSGTVLPTSTKAQQHRAKRALLVKQRSAESFSLEKGRKLLTEESEAKRGDSRGKMRKRSLSMPHIQCILEPVKEESPHSSLENTLHSKELSAMLQHAREQEFSQGLAENLGKICSSSADTEDNRWTSSPPPSEGVSGVSPVTQSRDLQDVDMPQLQFTMDKLGGGAIEEKPETSERIAFVISPDAAGVQGLLPKRKACRLLKVPNVDAESPPEELQLPRDRLTSTPDDKSVSQGLPVPQPHSALPQESFEMEEIGSTDVIPEEGAWPQGSSTLSCSHGNLPHQNSTQSDSSGFADDSHMGSDTPSLMETFKMEGLGSSAESLASARSVQTVIHMDNSQGEPVHGDRRQKNDMSFSPYCPMQLEILLDSAHSLPETHNVKNIVQEPVTVRKERSSVIQAWTLTGETSSRHPEESLMGYGNLNVCSSIVPNIALSNTHVNTGTTCVKSDDPCVKSDDPCVKSDDPCVKSDDPCVKSDDPCVHCGKLFQDHRNKECAFHDADLSVCLSEDLLPQFSIAEDAIVSQGASLFSAVNKLRVDNAASGSKETQKTETPIVHEGHRDVNSKDYNDDQNSDPKFTSQSGCQLPVFESIHSVNSVDSQPTKPVQTTTHKLQFPAELSQHYTLVDGIIDTLKDSIEKVTSKCNDCDGDQDVKITLQQTTEHLDWPEDVSKNIATEKLDHIRGVPYIRSGGQPVFPVKLSTGISVELTRNHSQGSPHVCKKYVLVEETKRYTKVKDSAGEDVKEIAVRRKKEVTAPPTAGNSRLWENLPENEKQESGEKALQNLQLFVKEARAKFRIRREADGECSDGKSGALLVQPSPTADSPPVARLVQPSPAADSPPVARLETGAAEDQGVQRCEKKDHKDEHDDKLCHEDASSMETNQQSDVRRNRAPSVAEELGMDIMEPVNRYTAEGIASDLQKTSSEVSIAYCTGSTEDLSTAQVHPLQDYWALTALVMSSRHEKLSELHLGAPGHYDLHFTSPKEHVIREVELARCCMVQYRRQLVHLQLLFAQCYAAFYNHMTGQERLEVESLVLLRAEVSREGEELQTLLGSHLQAVIEQDPAACVEDNPPSSMSKLQLLAQLIELLKEQGRMQQALALLVQNPAAQPGLHSPALPAPPLDTRQALHPLKQWELLAHDRERLQREVREIRQELCTEKEHRRRDMDKTLHRLRLSIMADVRQEIAEQMKLLRLQLQAKEEEVRMLRLQMRQQTKTRGDEGEGGSQTTRKSIRVTQL